MPNDNMRDAAVILATVGTICLLGIGLAANWTAAFVMVVAAALVWLGYWVAVAKLRSDRQRIKHERTALDAEWRALDRTRRVREIFLNARRAMHEEAQRQGPTTPDERGA